MPTTETIARPQQCDRLYLKRLNHHTQVETIFPGSDVRQGLSQTPKTLPAKYFYDDRGSQLFEQICKLPEYYVTRTEVGILKDFAPEIAQITGDSELVELGSGSSVKIRILLDAYSQLGKPLHYIPIDVSGSILEISALELLTDYPTLHVHGLIGTYERALAELRLPHLPNRTICFLGSTLGNLTPQECDRFFNQIASSLRSGEYFLLGVDLQKPQHILEAAYNDAQGITAEFNLNMLRHLNHKFDGNFDLTKFKHEAIYNQKLSRIEMHLHSLEAQTVQLRSLDLTFPLERDETILTEISRKFNLAEVEAELSKVGFKKIRVWSDPNQWFGLMLCQLDRQLDK